MEESKMMAYADRLRALREKKDELNDQLKELQREIDSETDNLIVCMQQHGCESFKHDGKTYSLVNKSFPRAIPELKPELYDAMKGHGYEHLFSINAQTLQGTLKEIRENNDGRFPDWLDPFVQEYTETGLQIRRA